MAFHCDDGHDHAGRHHEVILAFDDDAMHEYGEIVSREAQAIAEKLGVPPTAQRRREATVK